MIPAEELAAMQADQELWMPNTFVWKKLVLAHDGAGGEAGVLTPTVDPLTGLVNIPCRITTALATLQGDPAAAALMANGISYFGVTPARILLSIGDVMAVNDGAEYRVVYLDDSPTYRTATEAGLARL